MVTLRAFSNPAEAALAKSLLDDHNILCSLADENAYLYGGAPFAMPVRLLVAEDEAEEAARVLKNPDQHCADFESSERRQPARKNNPWELLAIAAFLLLPGLGLLIQEKGLLMVAPGRRIGRYFITVFSPTTAHLLGAFVTVVALLLVALFFYLRRVIMREQDAAALLRDESLDYPRG